MVGSSSGLSPYVFAKQPFSVTYTRPSGIHATKSSCTGSEPFCRVNVVVVLPVPERPTARQTLSPSSVGMISQPALLRLAEVVGVEDARDALVEVDHDQPVVREALRLQVRRVDDRQLGFE